MAPEVVGSTPTNRTIFPELFGYSNNERTSLLHKRFHLLKSRRKMADFARFKKIQIKDALEASKKGPEEPCSDKETASNFQ